MLCFPYLKINFGNQYCNKFYTLCLSIYRREANGKKYVRYEVIGANHVAVPTHFYKVIVGETSDGKLEMEAFVMPNKPIDDNTPLTNFQVLLCIPKNYKIWKRY